MREMYECEECGLIYWGEMINVVAGDREGTIGRHCPNCGEPDPTKRDIHKSAVGQ